MDGTRLPVILTNEPMNVNQSKVGSSSFRWERALGSGKPSFLP